MRRTKEQAEQTRVAILAAAEQLFLEKGVSHTTLEQIARAAGVTRGAVYWHFQNKAHLFHAMLDQVRLPPEQLAERLAGCAGADPLWNLRELCVASIEGLVQDQQKRRILTILLHRCEFTDELREAEERNNAFINAFISMVEDLLKRKDCIGRLRPGVTPQVGARSLHALIIGVFTDWTRDADLVGSQFDVRALFDIQFRGMVRDWDRPGA
ncbi:TetR family transcriptional regulator [Pseudomonas sp. RIT-PI-AD]|uniref:TetR family transcriptional regulator n=1 Tax=Pseudomonas sp. RIT-PI-AD TaxID=3035294 RepID=UPI0021D932E9|nr:TetR family transcriptional regulator [Pseudomonas sp. RIT-PI-AD]